MVNRNALWVAGFSSIGFPNLQNWAGFLSKQSFFIIFEILLKDLGTKRALYL